MLDSDTSDENDLQTDSPSMSWPLNRSSSLGPWTPPEPAPPVIRDASRRDVDASNLPNGKKALSGIAIRSFGLGSIIGVTTIASLHLIYFSNPLWRPLFFFAALSLFHFLEFYVTALYNTVHANVGAFLLTSNGSAYNIAHTVAVIECVVTFFVHPEPWSSIYSKSFGPTIQVTLGLAMMAIGQGARTMGMVEAATNFNHLIQSKKKKGHVLVTTGVYRQLRHPAYFGFFWWGLGTQVVLGNVVCFFAYLVVMWRFFSARIRREERLLVKFFDDDYIQYRRRTPVLIPFIP